MTKQSYSSDKIASSKFCRKSRKKSWQWHFELYFEGKLKILLILCKHIDKFSPLSIQSILVLMRQVKLIKLILWLLSCQILFKHISTTGIDSLLHSGCYKAAYILHDRSALESQVPVQHRTMEESDLRQELHDTWLKFTKFQPLWKIRNYFGEKIALYFAWIGKSFTFLYVHKTFLLTVFFNFAYIFSFSISFIQDNIWNLLIYCFLILGVLTTSLWIPSLLGIILFIYGTLMV